jgi:hypothetical protein
MGFTDTAGDKKIMHAAVVMETRAKIMANLVKLVIVRITALLSAVVMSVRKIFMPPNMNG